MTVVDGCSDSVSGTKIIACRLRQMAAKGTIEEVAAKSVDIIAPIVLLRKFPNVSFPQNLTDDMIERHFHIIMDNEECNKRSPALDQRKKKTMSTIVKDSHELFARVNVANPFGHAFSVAESSRRFFGCKVFDSAKRKMVYYRWTRLPLGHKACPSYFQAAIDSMMTSMKTQETIAFSIKQRKLTLENSLDDFFISASDAGGCSLGKIMLGEMMPIFGFRLNTPVSKEVIDHFIDKAKPVLPD